MGGKDRYEWMLKYCPHVLFSVNGTFLSKHPVEIKIQIKSIGDLEIWLTDKKLLEKDVLLTFRIGKDAGKWATSKIMEGRANCCHIAGGAIDNLY